MTALHVKRISTPLVQKRGRKRRKQPRYRAFTWREKHKIHAVVDGLGNPITLYLTPGNVSDCAVAVEVLSGVTISGSIVMGDKAYGTSEIRNYIETSGGAYCIPPKSNAVEPWDCDYHHYKERHVVECFFNKLKQFRHIAMRYDKLSRNFLSFAFLASAMILLK